MSGRRRSLPVAAACAVVMAVPGVAHAAPPPVECGAVLTVDTVLRHDLTCPGDGLRLEPGVTLDLRGHTVRGSGTGVGILVSSVGEIGIRNGTLTGWATAVSTLLIDDDNLDTGPLTIDRVRFRDNATGVDASGEAKSGASTKPTTITRSEFVGHTQRAISGTWFADVTVDRSTFTDNKEGIENGDGEVTVTRSRFVRNRVAVSGFESWIDIEDSVFQDNRLCVYVYSIGVVKVRGSRFVGSNVAIDGEYAELYVSSSTFVANKRAVELGEAAITVTGNVLRDNDEAITGSWSYGWGVTIQDNVLRGNGEGIVLNGDDSPIGLGGNDVRNSVGWGIHVPGAIDLGGNTARGNGNEPQCVGVVCAAY